jgi:hypothetical protein
MEDLVQHLPKLATGPSFQRVTCDHELYHVTENRGQEDLHPEPQWVEESWHTEIKLARETYKVLLEIGQVRNRQIAELVQKGRACGHAGYAGKGQADGHRETKTGRSKGRSCSTRTTKIGARPTT